MEKLFIDELPELDKSFRKEAGFASRLSENVESWPQELTSELFKQLPFLSDYEVNVNLAKVEPQRGFAFGYADCSNKTERPEMEHTESGLPHVRIPLVVQERAVKPFTIFLDGEKVLPLTEDRLREILFNPGTFDLSTSQPRDPSLIDPLMPPSRSGFGMGGETKTASASDAFKGTSHFGAHDIRLATEKAKAVAGHLLKGNKKKIVGAVGASAALHGAASYAGAKAGVKGGQEKTASMKQTVTKHFGDGGLQEIVDVWMAELDCMKNDGKGVTKEAMDKMAFNHMSKPQWDAIFQSDGVQKLVQKHGTPSHPEVVNKVYEVASKTFGFHPKVYSKPPQAMQAGGKPAAKDAKGGAQKPAQKPAQGQQKTASLLLAIAPTIRIADRDAFVEKIASDPTLSAGLSRSGIGQTLVEVMDTKIASSSDVLSELESRIIPNVITLQKLPGGDFLFKSANSKNFSQKSAKGEVVPGADAEEAIGPEAAMAMQPGQVATATSEPVEEQPLFETNERICDEFGEWLVADMMGNRHLGWVFPQTLAWDGNFTPQPLALFTNGSIYALQDVVAGELAGKGTTFPVDPPRGDGVFYATEGGKAICTAPVTIGSASMGPDGAQVFMGQDLFGTPVQIHVAEGLAKPTRVSDTEYALPSSWKFMRINNQTQLSSDPVQMNKAAAVRSAQTDVTLLYNGTYHFSGGCGLSKIASDLREDLDPVSAEFLLGVLGVDGTKVKQKLAEARRKGSVKLAGMKTITLVSEHFAEATKEASAFLSKIPDLRKDLIKEAAAIDDEGTVDNLLALNFINPENLGIFVSYMPNLEETSEKLAEMLLSSYLGMGELPEGALERGMKNMEEVLTSLKALQHAEA